MQQPLSQPLILLDLFDPKTWGPVRKVVRAKIPRSVLDYYKTRDPEDMYSDDREFLQRAFTRCNCHWTDEKEEEFFATIFGDATHLRSFHACKPITLDSYFRDGICPLTRERLAQLAWERLGGKVPIEELGKRAAAADLKTREGNVYFSADKDDFVESCGHYLIYGPESLNCLWGRENDGDGPLFVESQDRSRSEGIPTLFECAVPLAQINEVFRDELARTIFTQIIKRMVRPSYNNWNTNFGFAISTPLSPNLILSHAHPQIISDPLRNLVRYTNTKTRCPWCAGCDTAKN